MKVKKPEEEPLEIMLIPMIDCMLVIIIFFLVSTTMKSHEKELPLELPEANAALSVEQPPDLFVIGVDKQGVPYLSEEGYMGPVDTERLHQRIREVAQADPKRRVRVDADRLTHFEDVIRIVDLCQFEGLKNVGLHTKSSPGAAK